MQNKLPGSLQDKFQDFGSAPSEKLWNNISANLDEDKKRKGAFWWWFVGAAAVITLFFGVYQLGYDNGVSENDSTLVIEENQNSNDEIPNSNDENSNDEIQNSNTQIPNEENQNSVEQNLTNDNSVEKNNNTLTNSENDNLKIEENSNDNNKEVRLNNDIIKGGNINDLITIDPRINTETMPLDYLSDNSQKFKLAEIVKIDQSISEPKLDFEPLVQIQDPTSKNRWEFGFNVGTLVGFNSYDQNLLPDPNTFAAQDDLDENNSIEGTGITLNSTLSESKANVRRPLQFEMTIARDYGKRWNFQTGLGLGVIAGNNYYYTGSITNARSKFVSVSIPLHFNYNIVQRQRFSFYTGIGVIYEVPIFETVKTSYSNYALESTSTNNFTKGYMISAQLNTGFRYSFNEKLKLDFRPNLRYYIHQTMQSIYPTLERKVWVGASLGLVWQL